MLSTQRHHGSRDTSVVGAKEPALENNEVLDSKVRLQIDTSFCIDSSVVFIFAPLRLYDRNKRVLQKHNTFVLQ